MEQVVGGFKQAISIEEGGQPRLVVQNAVKLERPRSKLMVPEDFKVDAQIFDQDSQQIKSRHLRIAWNKSTSPFLAFKPSRNLYGHFRLVHLKMLLGRY